MGYKECKTELELRKAENDYFTKLEAEKAMKTYDNIWPPSSSSEYEDEENSEDGENGMDFWRQRDVSEMGKSTSKAKPENICEVAEKQGDIDGDQSENSGGNGKAVNNPEHSEKSLTDQMESS